MSSPSPKYPWLSKVGLSLETCPHFLKNKLIFQKNVPSLKTEVFSPAGLWRKAARLPAAACCPCRVWVTAWSGSTRRRSCPSSRCRTSAQSCPEVRWTVQGPDPDPDPPNTTKHSHQVVTVGGSGAWLEYLALSNLFKRRSDSWS